MKGSPALAINSSLRETKIHEPTIYCDANNRTNYIPSLPCLRSFLSLSLSLSLPLVREARTTRVRRSTKRTSRNEHVDHRSRTVDQDGTSTGLLLDVFNDEGQQREAESREEHSQEERRKDLQRNVYTLEEEKERPE